MRYTSKILLSFLLLGVSYARILVFPEQAYEKDDRMKKVEERYGELQDSMRGEKKNSQEDDSEAKQGFRSEDRDSDVGKENKRAFSTSDDMRNMRAHKIEDINYETSGHEYGPGVVFEDLPAFADPLYVGSASDIYQSSGCSHKNVQVYGLSSAYQASLRVDPVSHHAELTVNFKNVQIKGDYVYKKFAEQVSGDFDVKLYGNVACVVSYHYQMRNGEVHFEKSNAKFHYGDAKIHYENIGAHNVAPSFVRSVSPVLLQSVNDKVQDELYSKLYKKMGSHVASYAEQQGTYLQSERALKERVNQAADEIQRHFAKPEAATIDLTSDEKEMVYHRLHAKISSVKLCGLDKFYMVDKKVLYKDDKLRAKIQMAIRKPTATAILSIHDTEDEDAAFQKINVNFDIDQIIAELGMEKPAGASDLELRAIETYASNVQPIDVDRYEGEVNTLLKQKMPSYLKEYIERSLKNYIRNEAATITMRGMSSPSTQSKWYASEKQDSERLMRSLTP